MIALLWALIDRTNLYRQIMRLGLILVFVDFVALVIVETIIVAIVKTGLHQAVSIFGFCWMVATAFCLWFFGGAPADITLIAGMVKEPTEEDGWLIRTVKEACEPAVAVIQTVKFFFLFEGVVVAYFLVVPAWDCWTAHFALMVMLFIFVISGNLLGKKWPLKKIRFGSGLFTTLLVAAIFFASGYKFFTGKELTSEKLKSSLKGTVSAVTEKTPPAEQKEKVEPPKKAEQHSRMVQPSVQPRVQTAAATQETVFPIGETISSGEIIYARFKDGPAPAFVRWVVEDQHGTRYTPIEWAPGETEKTLSHLEKRYADRTFKVFIAIPTTGTAAGAEIKNLEIKKFTTKFIPAPRV